MRNIQWSFSAAQFVPIDTHPIKWTHSHTHSHSTYIYFVDCFCTTFLLKINFNAYCVSSTILDIEIYKQHKASSILYWYAYVHYIEFTHMLRTYRIKCSILRYLFFFLLVRSAYYIAHTLENIYVRVRCFVHV